MWSPELANECASLGRRKEEQRHSLLYSWRFTRYSAPIHCHMTSNNKTVSRQMPWAGNVAKTMTSNRKQFTVTREMLTAVARHLSITRLFVSTGLTHLLCYIKNHSMTGPEGNSEFCVPRISMFPGTKFQVLNVEPYKPTFNPQYLCWLLSISSPGLA